MNIFLFIVFWGAQLVNYNYKLTNSDRSSIYDQISKTTVSFVIVPTPHNHLFKIEEMEPYKLRLNINSQISSIKEIRIKKLILRKKEIETDILELNDFKNFENINLNRNTVSLFFDEFPVYSKLDDDFIIDVEIEIKDQNLIYTMKSFFMKRLLPNEDTFRQHD